MTATIRRVTWPIDNPDLPLTDLRAEAIECLHITAITHGWTITGKALLHVNHGQHPTMTATINVDVPDGLVAA